MTQEEKQLLLIDLCGRLPYNPFVNCVDSDTKYKCVLTTAILDEMRLETEYYEYKPYLRPMSSMTEEEINISDDLFWKGIGKLEDWLNEHHFDYRGLIPMGLALEAPEDMY